MPLSVKHNVFAARLATTILLATLAMAIALWNDGRGAVIITSDREVLAECAPADGRSLIERV